MKIYVVDDEEANRLLLEAVLEENYDVISCSSGQECLDHIDDVSPDALLLDVNMPTMNGLQVCESIRQRDQYKSLPIIFLSALTQLSDRLKGYEAGGDDYLTKPFEIDEVDAKIKLLVGKHQEQVKLAEDKSAAVDAAFNAMSNAGDIGNVKAFLERAQLCGYFEELGDELLNALAVFSLSAVVQIRTEDGVLNESNTGVTTELEKELLNKVFDRGRIIDFGARSVFNYGNISLLIRNMPVADQDAYGRYKDSIASLMVGAEARYKNIRSELELKKRRSGAVEGALQDISHAMSRIKKLFVNHDQQTSAIMDQLMNDMQLGLSSLALTEQQEEYFLSLVDNSMSKLVTLYTSGMEIDRGFEQIEKDLKKILSE